MAKVVEYLSSKGLSLNPNTITKKENPAISFLGISHLLLPYQHTGQIERNVYKGLNKKQYMLIKIK
jgi:hypothetical protein